MTTLPLELPVAFPAPEPIPAPESVPAPTSARARRGAEPVLRRAPVLLAPTLPALLLVGLCVAGLTDPPAPTDTGSRLHISSTAPAHPDSPR
jgi:hypothetical protein